MRVPPVSNCLALIFREPEVLNFLKYITALAKDKVFYLLNCSFFGTSDENESEDSLSSAGEEAFEDDFSDEEEFVSNSQ